MIVDEHFYIPRWIALIIMFTGWAWMYFLTKKLLREIWELGRWIEKLAK